jgi:hypothetical protein
MSFANFRTSQPRKTYRKTEFINLSVGMHVVRLLDPEAVVKDTHYIHSMTYECLGKDCPVCNNNSKLWTEFGDEAPKANGFIGLRQMGYVNVLDRTVAKVCPKCGADVKRMGQGFPANCPKCNESVLNVREAPLNKVRVLSKGKLFFDQIEFYKNNTLDAQTQTPLDINSYDLAIMVMNKTTAPVVSTLVQNNDVVQYNPEDLFELEKCAISVNASEMLDALKGVSLKDIFRARSVNEQVANLTEHGQPTGQAPARENTVDSIRSEMGGFFNN